MKKIAISILVIFLLLLCSCDPEQKSKGVYNPGITSIKDFAKYSSIGMRAVNAKGTSRAVQSVEDMRYQLVAMDRDTGTIDSFYMGTEAGSYVDSGKLNVYCYEDTEPFLIVQFVNWGKRYQGYGGHFDYPCDYLSPLYLISKETGRIYTLGEGMMLKYNDILFEDGYGCAGSVLYCIPRINDNGYNCFFGGSNESIICKLYEDEGKITITPWLRGQGTSFIVDKYGNILINGGVITPTKEVIPCSMLNAFVGYDGLIHYGDKAINSDGEVYTFGSTPDKSHTFTSSHLLVTEGNTRWYYYGDYLGNAFTGGKSDAYGIYKLEFTDDTLGEFTVVDEFLFNQNTVRVGWKFFKRVDNDIYTYEYPSGTRTSKHIDGMTLYEIKATNGKIYYKGLSDDLVTIVSGYLDPVTLEETSAPTVHYEDVAPLYMSAL